MAADQTINGRDRQCAFMELSRYSMASAWLAGEDRAGESAAVI
jgi:hypothetical protein